MINSYIIQEGIPTIQKIDNNTTEICTYMINNNFIGGFYRINSEKGTRQNLNSRGMYFKSFDPDGTTDNNENINSDDLFIFKTLSKISGIASQMEIFNYSEVENYEFCIFS